MCKKQVEHREQHHLALNTKAAVGERTGFVTSGSPRRFYVTMESAGISKHDLLFTGHTHSQFARPGLSFGLGSQLVT